MEENEAKMSTMDAEQHMLAAIHHLVKAVGASNNLTDNTKRILAELDHQFSTITILGSSETERIREVEYKLKSAQRKIINFQPNHFKIWDSSYQELSDYLQAVDEVQRLREVLESMSSENELVNQSHRTMQIAMEKLQEVLIKILARNKQCFEYEYLSVHPCEENFSCEESLVLNENDSVESTPRRESSSAESDYFSADIVHPDVVPLIKSIAKTMFASQHHLEFCQAFVSFWRYACNEYLAILNVERLSIEDVHKMEWNFLNSKIKKWLRAVKGVVGFYLVSLKSLFNQVLGEFGSVSTTCFIEATKSSVISLVNFGLAIAMGPQRPERLFCLLDMYDVVTDHFQDLNALFEEEAGSFIRMEFHNLLSRLGYSAKVIFLGFGNEVASNTSTIPFPNGAIPHLTKYVMNYIALLEEYGDTLNFILEEKDSENSSRAIPEEDEQEQNPSTYISSPVAHHLQLVITILETKLDEKSNLYGNSSLKHIFIMNNVHYIVRKIRNSKIRNYFGDEWIREHIVKFQQCARSYERVTWSSILSFLKDDGIKTKAILKERCRGFSSAFEEIYKIQTGWYIPDLQLREDLRISTSQTVVNAYRAFVSRITTCVCDKYIKYTVEELENCILDLYGGSQKSLNYSWRK